MMCSAETWSARLSQIADKVWLYVSSPNPILPEIGVLICEESGSSLSVRPGCRRRSDQAHTVCDYFRLESSPKLEEIRRPVIAPLMPLVVH
jgi:hypothetical protein